MTSAVNTGQILEALNDKLDRDTLNINDTGEINMASMGLPSTRVVSFSPPASGGSFSVPSNGWFAVRGTPTGLGQYLELTCRGIDSLIGSTGANYDMAVYIPVNKGDTVTLYYYLGTNSPYNILFIYAQGSESEASS